MQKHKEDELDAQPLISRDPSSSHSYPPSSPGSPPPVYHSHSHQASTSFSPSLGEKKLLNPTEYYPSSHHHRISSAFSAAESEARGPASSDMASFMMSPYPAGTHEHDPEVPYGAPYSNTGHEAAPVDPYTQPEYGAGGNGYPEYQPGPPPPGEDQPYVNQQPTDGYPWRLDAYQDSVALNDRRKEALDEVDKAYFSRFHAKVVAIVGAGFFTDAYDTFVIDTAASMLGFVYGHATASNGTPSLSSSQILGLKAAGPIGTFFGMLIFGFLGDRLGRKRIYGMELFIIITAVFVQSMLGQARSVNIINSIIVWRFIMGVGIGGDYPTSAVIASEFAPVATRGRMVTAVFATQGLGQLVGAIVSVVIVYAYKHALGPADIDDVDAVADHLDQMWRILVGFGCVPGALALLFRFTIPETPRFTMDIARNVNQASQDIDTFLTTGSYYVDPDARVEHVLAPKMSWADWTHYFSKQRNFFILLGTCYSWFALDIAFYGLSLNSVIILNGIFPTHATDTIWAQLHNIVARATIPICTGLIPGYIAAFFIIDRYGRRWLQLVGFAVLFVLLLIMGFGFNVFTKENKDGSTSNANRAFLVLYCLASFFLNCGPNTTTFVIAGESFPTRYRSTMNGVAAASGKLGAIISQLVIYAQLKGNTSSDVTQHETGIKVILIVFAFFMLSGVASTWIIPETKEMSLEDNSDEDQNNFIKGPALTVIREGRRQ